MGVGHGAVIEPSATGGLVRTPSWHERLQCVRARHHSEPFRVYVQSHAGNVGLVVVFVIRAWLLEGL
jgi:hypothetical protein